MARYIDANKIHYHQKENIDGYIYSEYVSKDEIDAVPTEDVEPVRRGHWTPHGSPPENIWCCSECKALTETAHYCNKCYYDYCPNCGTKMRGEENA